MVGRARLAALLALGAGCGGKDGPAPSGDGGAGDGGAADSADTGAGTYPYDPADTCGTLGLPARDWDESGDDSADLDGVVGDLTLAVTDVDGHLWDWSLREAWTGCEVYLFISDGARQVTSWGWSADESFFETDIRRLLENAPDNTRIFFISGESDEADRAADLALALDETLTALDRLDEAEAAWWRDRILFVQDRDRDLPGWLGAHFSSDDWGVGVDRFQRLRFIGSYADYARYDASEGWFQPNVKMAAWEAIRYDYEAERAEEMASWDATTVPVFSGEVIGDPDWAGSRATVEVELPEDLSAFDSMAFDLTLGCNGEGEYGTCPAWDYLVYLYQDAEAADGGNPYADTACTPGEDAIGGPCVYPDGTEAEGSYACKEDGSGYEDLACPSRELGRWITTYHRIGRWVHDVSPLLPLLGSGGSQRWSFYTQQEYVVDLSVHLWNAGKEARPSEATLLFTGGRFDEDYNDREPVTVAIPADAKKVELATVLSGHGQVSPGNCAEFCETDHDFIVNDEHHNVIALDEAGTSHGCMDKVDQGVIPNQYGTWWYGRSGWCPGWQVPVQVTDITDQVAPGEDNRFAYEGTYQGGAYTGDGAQIILSAWLVVSR